MKLSKGATEYLSLLGELFKARFEGRDDTEILDKMDKPLLTTAEQAAMSEISRAVGRISTD